MPDIKEPTVVGPNCKFGAYVQVWHFTTLGFGVELGDYVTVGSHCYIGNHTRIGANSRLQTGVFLPNYSVVGESVFIGPNVTCTDDRYPRVGNRDYTAEPPIFKDGCSVGAGAVILPGVTIGEGAVVGAGCVVTSNVPDHAVVVGNPSKIIRIANPLNEQGELWT